MSDRSEQIAQQLLIEIEACKQAIQELSDEELAEIAGGTSFSGAVQGYKTAAAYGGGKVAQVKSAMHVLVKSESLNW